MSVCDGEVAVVACDLSPPSADARVGSVTPPPPSAQPLLPLQLHDDTPQKQNNPDPPTTHADNQPADLNTIDQARTGAHTPDRITPPRPVRDGVLAPLLIAHPHNTSEESPHTTEPRSPPTPTPTSHPLFMATLPVSTPTPHTPLSPLMVPDPRLTALRTLVSPLPGGRTDHHLAPAAFERQVATNTAAPPTPIVVSDLSPPVARLTHSAPPPSTKPILPRPVKIMSPTAASNTMGGSQSRYAFPVFRPDGDVATSYINQQHVLRKRRVADAFLLYALIFLILEIPYILHTHWTIERNFVPIILRIFNAIIIYMFVVANRRLYVARFITQTTERFDGMVCAVLITSSLFLCVMETQRQWRDETYFFLDSSGFPTLGVHLSCMDPILEDGVLLALSLLYAFAAGVAKIRWMFVATLGGAAMIIWTVCIVATEMRTYRYLLLSLGYQLILVLALIAVSYRNERAKLITLDRQKVQFLERKKAEKLLRSMLPTRILSDYLDGNIGQLQSTATIGFLQMHLGALQEKHQQPPGSHQPTAPHAVAISASPGELMQKLHDTFKRIDGIVSMYAIRGVTKIETVATTYLLCAGLLQEIDDHAAAMIDVSLEILSMVTTRLNIGGAAKRIPVMMRIGISSGPVCGGIIGAQRRFFRVFGDTVNVAARMCTNVSMGCIQISPSCYASLSDRQKAAYKIPPGRSIDIKGKGEMTCYLVESRADWVAKFGKATMNRGQQDRDEPLLNKSFVYHKLLARTDLAAGSLLFQQENGSGPSLEKQATFVRQARSASQTDRLTNNSTSPPSAHATPIAHTKRLNAHASNGGVTAGTTGGPADHARTSHAHDEGVNHSTAGPAAARSPSQSRLRTRASAALNGGADKEKLPAAAGASSQAQAPCAPAVSHEPSPFAAVSIEKFFQRSYARDLLSDLRWATLAFAGFQLGVLIYVVAHHPDSDPNSSDDWTTSKDSISPLIMIATILVCFLLFDALSLAHNLYVAFRSFGRRPSPVQVQSATRLDRRRGSTSESPQSMPLEMTLSMHARRNSINAVGDNEPSQGEVASCETSHFARYLQCYSAGLALLIHAWPLVGLQLWGIEDTTEIHPVFAMILVTVYSCFFLRLQFRFISLLASSTWLIFLVLMVVDGFSLMHCLLILVNLFVGMVLCLSVLYLFERTSRSNFLQAYALEKEQEYMDQFLNNLLPKDVVLVLKKQNPSLAREVVRATPQSRAAVKGLRPMPFPSPMTIGEGGMASRFAMHFPRTTVFESDIVGYTKMVSNLSPSDTLNLLNLIFSRFDSAAQQLGVEKIETIGDAFMCMVFDGPPDPVLDFALLIVGVLAACCLETQPRQDLQIRMGICTGSCFGGIVGTEIPRFHLFGQAHDVAIHIEQNGRPGEIIVSSSTHQLSADRYEYEPLDLVVDDYHTFLLHAKKPESDATLCVDLLPGMDHRYVPIVPEESDGFHSTSLLPQTATSLNGGFQSTLHHPSLDLIRGSSMSVAARDRTNAQAKNSPASITCQLSESNHAPPHHTSAYPLPPHPAHSQSHAASTTVSNSGHRSQLSVGSSAAPTVTMSIHTSMSAVASASPISGPDHQHLIISNQQFVDPNQIETETHTTSKQQEDANTHTEHITPPNTDSDAHEGTK